MGSQNSEILDDELLLLHYLHRRIDIEQTLTYTGDELDPLVTYLETGLAFPEEAKHSMINMADLTGHLHPHFMGKEQGLSLDKPTRRLTEWWNKLAYTVSRNQDPRLRSVAFALLDIPFEQKKEIEAEFEKVKSQVAANTQGKPMLDSFHFQAGPTNEPIGIVLFAAGEKRWNQGKEEVKKIMENLAAQVLSESDCQFVYVFAVYIGLNTLPYSLLAVFERPKDGS